MIDRIWRLHTEEQANKLKDILNGSSKVWGACVDGRNVIVSFYNEAGLKWGEQKFDEVYDYNN